jgi:hypothetical protein
MTARRLLAVVPALALAAFALPAAAETWRMNSQGGNHFSLLDTDYLSRSGNTAKVREMKLYDPAEEFNGQMTRAWIIEYEVNCTDGTYSTRSAQIYDDTVKVVLSSPLNGEPKRPNAGTVGEDMINTACGRRQLLQGRSYGREEVIRLVVGGGRP